MTTTRPSAEEAKPSISTSSWLSVCSRSELLSEPRRAPTASSSSMKMIAGCALARLAEQAADARGAQAGEHLDERRRRLREEVRARLVGHGLGQQRLARARAARGAGRPWAPWPPGARTAWASRRKSTTSRSSAFASSTPAMSSQPTSRLASGLISIGLVCGIRLQRPPQHDDQRDHEEDREDGLPVVGEVADAVEHARRRRDRRQRERGASCRPRDDLQDMLACLGGGVAGHSEQGRCSKHAWCIGSLSGFLQPRAADESARRFDAQDLGQRGAADLELLLGRLARAQHALELVPGPAQRARQRGVARGARTTRRPRRRRRSTRAGPRRRPAATGAPPRGAGARCRPGWRPAAAP